jgi:ubiquinone/menaquinone biosynthesis C-methylase UbiE/uncharacterized protein YbaR (Trm112 family)
MRKTDVELLRCPDCKGELSFEGSLSGVHLAAGALRCGRCGTTWPVEDGLPLLYREEKVEGNDRLMRHIYDNFSRLHDPALRYLLPYVDTMPEYDLRDGYMRRMDLASLAPRPDGRPVRILEVSIGGGANLRLIRRDLPPHLPVEVWGVDLSRGMIARCLEKAPTAGLGDVRIAVADAHVLPFPDATFDRVFHVGGIGGFRDPAAALAEMGRVAVPGTPIAVMDEQLDRAARNNLLHQAFFKLLTFYDDDPHCPREHLPAAAVDVVEDQVSRYFYCLTFRMPVPPAGDRVKPSSATPRAAKAPRRAARKGRRTTRAAGSAGSRPSAR